MYQLKSSYSNPFKDSYSDTIHPCFTMIATYVTKGYSAVVEIFVGKQEFTHLHGRVHMW